MISAKDLTDEQRSKVEEWARDGSQLADIQKLLKSEFGLNATYMDTRFLILDLGLELQSDEPEEVEPEIVSDDVGLSDDDGDSEAGPSPLDPGAPQAAGGVSVATDELARPGALVSGSVTFSDGEKALWLIDQMGRLGLEADTPGYQPSESDAIVFEKELRKLLEQ